MRNNKNGDMGAMQGALFLDKCIESGTPMHVIGSGSLHPNNCTPISGETEGNNVKKREMGRRTGETWKENWQKDGKEKQETGEQYRDMN